MRLAASHLLLVATAIVAVDPAVRTH